jgi:hypothetical protein
MEWAGVDYFIFAVLSFTLYTLSICFLLVYYRSGIRLALAIGLLDTLWASENAFWFLTFKENYPIINGQYPWYGILAAILSIWTLYELYRRHFKDD